MAQFNTFETAIDFSFWRDTCEKYGSIMHFHRGEYFAHAGSMLRQVGWIVSGGFKHTLIDKAGNEKVVGFVFDGTVLANYESALLGKPMPTNIVALEDSEAWIVATEIMKKRFVYDPTLNINFVQALFGQAYEQILNTYRFTPAERYCQLLSRFPQITQLVSLKDIASYLNISYRQLLRIRETYLKNKGYNLDTIS